MSLKSIGKGAYLTVILDGVISIVTEMGTLGGPAKGCSSFNYRICVDREIFIAEKTFVDHFQ